MTAATELASREPGASVSGRYLIEAQIGRGGMGAVYRAFDESTGRRIALKQLANTGRRSDRLRFRREFHTLASLQHPRIVRVFEYGVDEVGAYYTMELLDGDDLRVKGALPWLTACRILRDVSSALALLHSRRLLHRDLSARNVRLTGDGNAKLIDFGVLCTIGSAGDLVGTPPYMAPEMLNGAPLDQRADLFGLGALAYWLLTGTDAYPAVRLDQITEARNRPPPPPSARGDGIPRELDDLVLSLLSLEVQNRIGTAPEVIERLSAIGKLAAAPELETARGYVQSASLVGRDKELAALRSRLRRTMEGAGRAVVVFGRSGAGKSRLLRELGIEAQLAGATVVHARAELAGFGPFGLVRRIGEELLAMAPDARGEGDVGVPAILAREGASATNPEGLDPREHRSRLQSELARFFLAVSRKKPLVILVDDVQRSDEASCALLAMLATQARDHPLMIGCSLRTDEVAVAPDAVEAFASSAHRVRVAGLDEKGVTELVRGIFGDAPNTASLAHFLLRTAGGSPLSCTEVVRHLVDDGVITYRDAMWVLPHAFDASSVPSSLMRTMDARVRTLSDGARALGAVLSVHGGDIPLEVCVSLAETGDEAAVFEALDELVREEIVVGEADVFRFRHDGLREALERSLDASEKRQMHLRVGRALLENGVAAARESEVGWHLLYGGDAQLGADFLARAGLRFFETTSFRDAVRPLEAALEVLRHSEPGSARVLDLMHTLLAAGCFCDPQVVMRHGDATIRLLAEHAGVERIRETQKKLGQQIGLATALATEAARYRMRPKKKRGKRPLDLLRMYARAVIYTAAVSVSCLDLARLDWLAYCLKPLSAFRAGNGEGVYRLVVILSDYVRGHSAPVRRETTALLEQTSSNPGPTSAAELTAFLGALRFVRALTVSHDGKPDIEQEIVELEALDVQIWNLGALELRMHHHLSRGEAAVARVLQGRLELEHTRLGSGWQADISLPLSTALLSACNGDVLALKRSIELLGKVPEPSHQLICEVEAGRAEYLRLRGDYAAAERKARDTLELMRGEGIGMLWVLAALADVLLDSGRFEDARRAAEEAHANATDPVRGRWIFKMRTARTLALAEAHVGDIDAARNRLAVVIEEAEVAKNPAILGQAHEAAARVAWLAGDDLGFEHHRASTELAYRSTENPVLMARVDRLVRSVRDPSGDRAFDSESAMTIVEASERSLQSVLSGCRDSAERASRALGILAEESKARSGFLFLADEEGLKLAASIDGSEPSPEVRLAAEQMFDAAGSGVRWGELFREEGSDFAPLALFGERAEMQLPVGVAVLGSAGQSARPALSLLDALGEALIQSGDVRSGSVAVTLIDDSSAELVARKK